MRASQLAALAAPQLGQRNLNSVLNKLDSRPPYHLAQLHRATQAQVHMRPSALSLALSPLLL
jgi:hypothetical protein